MKLLLIVFSVFCLTGFVNAQLKDQDSNSYKTVLIGNRAWMTENYKAVKLNNGQKIAFAKNSDEWIEYFESKTPCYTYANFDVKNKNNGLIYNYFAAHSQYIAPESWTVPGTDDWDKMVFSIGQYDIKTALKLKQNAVWKSAKASSNLSGFSASPMPFLKFCGAFTDPQKYQSVSYWRLDKVDEENGENACSFSVSESGKMELAQGYTGATAGYYIRLCKILKPDEVEKENDDDAQD